MCNNNNNNNDNNNNKILVCSTVSTSLPIWLDNVHCSSSENCLIDCESCPSFQHSYCNHSKDVSLECRK